MNGGKDVRLGDDKRPISVVPSDEQFLYNIRDGNILTDEFGNNLITETDTFYLPDASTKRSTSVVFDDKDTPYTRLVHTEVGLTTGYYVDHRDLDVYLKGTAESTIGIGGSISVLQRSGAVVGVGTTARFPLGSYIEVNEEIMRVASSTLTGSGSNEITVLRGSLGTAKQDHPASSLIKKIKPIAIELRRPSILRASGHTFEYLGYGPGNYSTGLPPIHAPDHSLSSRHKNASSLPLENNPVLI